MNKGLNGKVLNPPPPTNEEKWGKLGKLYLFPVERPDLKAQGIEKQWFLTHQKGDRLFCGHVNNRGEWSLCRDKDLTPTHHYQAVDEVWKLLANDDFVTGLKSETEVQRESNSDESDGDEPIKRDKTEKKNTLIEMGVSPLASTPQDTDVEVELDEEELAAYQRQQKESEELSDESLNLGEEARQTQPFSFIDDSPIPTPDSLPVLVEEEEAGYQVTEQERQLLERDLQTLIWQGYQADLLNVEEQEPEERWLIELNENTHLIQLICHKDKHRVISLNRQGAIVDHLSLEDADLLVDGLILHEEGNQKEEEEQGVSKEEKEQGVGSREKEEKEQGVGSREKEENTASPLLENDSLSSFELNKQKQQKPKGLEIE